MTPVDMPPVHPTQSYHRTDPLIQHAQGYKGLWVPDGWGSEFASRPDVMIFGDSVTEQWSAVDNADGYMQQVATAVKALRGDGGSGWIGVDLNQQRVQGFLAGAITPVRCDATANWIQVGDGYGGCEEISTVVGAWLEFDGTGDTIDIIYERNTVLGTIRVEVDGVVVADNVSTAGAQGTQKLTYAHGQGTTQHTVRITNLQAAGSGINGVIFRNAAGEGVRFNNYSKSGVSSGYWAGATYPSTPATLRRDSVGTHHRPINCGLVVFSFGINDANADIAEATYLANLQADIDAWSYYLGYLNDEQPTSNAMFDTLFILQPFENANRTRFTRYNAAIRTLCDQYGAAFYNAHSRLKGNSVGMTANGWAEAADPVHPNTDGHTWLAEPLIELLTSF